jgi:methylated-DNA-[protein]-cysteine S-methyltransferase
MTATATLETPVGRLALVLADDGTVVASGFGDLADLVVRAGAGAETGTAPPDLVEPVAAAVDRYFSGDLGALDEVAVRQSGGPFAQDAWRALRDVQPGAPVTYAELAELAGSPGAARAAGQACARNLVAPFVPCHRVVPATGGVGGYAYGAAVKERLLAHERGDHGEQGVAPAPS